MSLMQRISTFLRSPQRAAAGRAGRRELAKPENQRKLRQLAARLSSRRR